MTHLVVAGAGIGGLAAALALARRGIAVTLFERSPVFEEVGAGLQLAPNATRVLHGLGLLPRLEQLATEPDRIRIRDYRGRDIAGLPAGDMARQRFGTPFLLIHRADLQRALLEAAASCASIQIFTRHRVGHATEHDGRLAIQTNDAETFDADGLVAANGIHAGLRLGPASRPGQPRFGGKVAWRTLVPGDRVEGGALRPDTNLWLGPHAHLVHYPLRGGALVNVIATVADPRLDAAPDPWATGGDPATLARHFAGWAPEARAILAAAESWMCWPLFDRSSASAWSQGRFTLLGDAAHPMLPFLAQGASQAIEDSEALARAVADHPRDVPSAFRAYEQRRRARAERVQQASRQQGTIYHLSGLPAVLRNEGLRRLGPARLLQRYDWLYGADAAS